MVRITPDPSWKGGSKRGTHVVSIDRLKLYHGNTTLIPKRGTDIEMSDDEFAEHLHLTERSSDKSGQNRKTIVEKKEEGRENDSEEDPEELEPSQWSGPNTPGPGAASSQQPTTPLTRAQAAIRRAAAQQRQNKAPIPSPPLTRARSAKKRSCEEVPQLTPRAARLDPGLNTQPRVVLSPIDRHIPTRTPVPPDMANYYRNYKSPGRGKSWGPANKHPPSRPHIKYPEFHANSNLADGKGPLPRQRRTPWQPPDPSPSIVTPPHICSLPDVSMESLSGLDAFKPRQYDEPPILEGDAQPAMTHSPAMNHRHPRTTRRPQPLTQITYQRTRMQMRTTHNAHGNICTLCTLSF